MKQFTFAPALGPIAGYTLTAFMVVAAIVVIIMHVKRPGDETWAMTIRRSVLLLLVALLAATPSFTTTTTSRAVNATDVVIAADITGSMAVKDAQYGSQETITRLDAARDAIDDITSTYAHSQFAALSFGSQGTVDVPLTPDVAAINTWARTLQVEPTDTSSGSSPDALLDQLLLTVKDIRDAHADDTIIVYIITDGEQTSSTVRRTFSSLRKYIDDACVIGVGSEQGSTIPQVTTQGVQEGQWVEDPDTGKPGVSIMDVNQIQSMADELSGSYIIASSDTTLLNADILNESSSWTQSQTYKERVHYEPIVWPIALAIVILAAWEAGAWLAQSKKLVK